jgi:hypothetical protein
VLNATAAGVGSNVENLLVYAHCSQQHAGGLALLMINTDDQAMAIIFDEEALAGAREEYVL